MSVPSFRVVGTSVVNFIPPRLPGKLRRLQLLAHASVYAYISQAVSGGGVPSTRPQRSEGRLSRGSQIFLMQFWSLRTDTDG